MASIGELFIELGVKTDTASVNKINTGFKNLRTNLLLTAGAFTGAIVGLDRFVNSALKGVVALQNINAQTGLSIEKLQQFQQAGQLSNLALSADQIAQSIANVQTNLAQIRIGQGNIAPFQLLGVDIAGADAFDVIEQLRDSIQGIDPAIATSLISQLGLSPDFINLLKLSREEFEALGQNTFLNPKQRANIDRVGTSIKAVTLSFKALKDQAVAKIAPELNDLVQKFFKWLRDNGDKIIRVITSMARGFATFAQAIGNAFDLSARFIDNISDMENGIKILTVAIGFLSLSFSPFLAGLAAIILLLDDIAVFRAGGESLIGDFVELVKSFPGFDLFFGDTGVITKTLDAISSIIERMIELKNLIGDFEFLGATKEFTSGIADSVANTITDSFDGLFGTTFGSPVTVNNNFTTTVSGVNDATNAAREVERAQRNMATSADINLIGSQQGRGTR